MLLRALQGRLGEWSFDASDPAIDNTPGPVPALRVWAWSLRGNDTDARRSFELMAAKDFDDLPEEAASMASTLALLSEVCFRLRDEERAPRLYELLRPLAPYNVTVYDFFFGSASRYLGQLASLLGRRDDAEQHFEEAVAMNERFGALPWTALTQYDWACLLEGRREAGDAERAGELTQAALTTARDLGMAQLEQEAQALHHRLQGVVPLRRRQARR